MHNLRTNGKCVLFVVMFLWLTQGRKKNVQKHSDFVEEQQSAELVDDIIRKASDST